MPAKFNLSLSLYLFIYLQFDWPITKKIMKLWGLCKIERPILKYQIPSLWPMYIGEKEDNIAKAYGIKVRYYGECVGEHIENLMGTQWEHIENLMGTQWEHNGNTLKTLWEHNGNTLGTSPAQSMASSTPIL
jgi:hypothetical protein